MCDLAFLLQNGHVTKVRDVCPRCSDGLPICTDPGYRHETTCDVYEWADDLCLACKVELSDTWLTT